MSGEEQSLFDCFVVVGLQAKGEKAGSGGKGGGGYVTEITYQFPPAGNSETLDALCASSPGFCFPDLVFLEATEEFASETFSFVLTATDGSKRYGYCRRLLPPGQGARVPECFCLISSLPCYALFSQVLDIVEQRRAISSVAVFTFLKTVLGQAFPAPGEEVDVAVFSTQSATRDRYTLERPAQGDSLLEYVDLEALFAALPLSVFLQVFASVLMERRLIIYGSQLALLSQACLAIAACINPFTWQHIFIPVLPGNLLDTCTAPMPFLVGVLSEYMEYVQRLPLEDVVFVDLDKGAVYGVHKDKSLLPSGALSALSKGLERALGGKTPDQGACLEAFLDFFATLFEGYTEYYEETERRRGMTMALNETKFLKSRNRGTRKFLEAFFETQLCHMYLSEQGDAMYAQDGQLGAESVLDERIRERKEGGDGIGDGSGGGGGGGLLSRFGFGSSSSSSASSSSESGVEKTEERRQRAFTKSERGGRPSAYVGRGGGKGARRSLSAGTGDEFPVRGTRVADMIARVEHGGKGVEEKRASKTLDNGDLGELKEMLESEGSGGSEENAGGGFFRRLRSQTQWGRR